MVPGHDSALSEQGMKLLYWRQHAGAWELSTPASTSLQVAMNQFILGPIVLTTVFSWNLILQSQPRKIPDKIKDDLVPGAINGMQSVTVPGRCRPAPQLF